MKNCETIKYLLTLYALDNLGGVSKLEVERHLKECPECRAELAEIKVGLKDIKDVLSDTSCDGLHMSNERYDAIIRASEESSLKTNFITRHYPVFSIASGIMIILFLTFQVVTRTFKQPLKSVDICVRQETSDCEEHFPESEEVSFGLETCSSKGLTVAGSVSAEVSTRADEVKQQPAPVASIHFKSALTDQHERLSETSLLETAGERGDVDLDLKEKPRVSNDESGLFHQDVDAVAVDRSLAVRTKKRNVQKNRKNSIKFKKMPTDKPVNMQNRELSSQTDSMSLRGSALGRPLDIASEMKVSGAEDILDEEFSPEESSKKYRKNNNEIAADLSQEDICEEIEEVSEYLADYENDGKEIIARQSMIRVAGVNPYVQTVENAFSTFSIDVDTASYNLCRRYMQAGLFPPPEIVRTEEFINAFDYHYIPSVNQTFRIYTDIAPSPFAHGQYMMKIGVKGKRLGREEQKQAVLTFLVDTSGSMKRADRIGLIKQSLRFLLEQLDENDKVAIVQYGTKARLVLEHTLVKDSDTIMKTIDSLQCSGATDLEDGMLLAYKVAADGYVPNSENKVLLLSDGVANIGEGAAHNILTKIQPYIKQGITCSIYGFGIGSYDDVMLETLADKGNGIYAYVGNIRDAEDIFSGESAAVLNLIASDVKIQVEFSPSVVKQYRQLGYENRQLSQQNFRNDTVDAGEIGSGQSVTALYELELTENKGMQPWSNSQRCLHSGDVLAIVRVRYKDINSGVVHEIEQKVRERDIESSFENMPTEYRLAVSVAEFAEQLRNSPYAQNNFRDILNIMTPVANELPLDSKVQELKNFIQYAPNWSR